MAPSNNEGVGMARGSVKDVEDYLTPSEAGRVLGTSGQWVKQLARRGELYGVETHLGWLIEPESVKRLAGKRLAKAESKVSSLKTARAHAGVSTAGGGAVRGRSAHGASLKGMRKGPRTKRTK
jgi:hypothetical protein